MTNLPKSFIPIKNAYWHRYSDETRVFVHGSLKPALTVVLQFWQYIQLSFECTFSSHQCTFSSHPVQTSPLSPPSVATMTDIETISSLTNALSTIRLQQPLVSLRLWYDEGKLQFFFTNLPPRNKRNLPANPAKYTGEYSTQHPPPPRVPSPPPPPVKKGRGRKRQNISSTPDHHSTPTEQLRSADPVIDLQPTFIEHRDTSIASVPCSNSFEALSNLANDDGYNDQDCNSTPSETEHGDGELCGGADVDCPIQSEAAPPYMCTSCSGPFKILSNTDKITICHHCRGRKCSRRILAYPDLLFYKCSCSYAPFVCKDCLVDPIAVTDIKTLWTRWQKPRSQQYL